MADPEKIVQRKIIFDYFPRLREVLGYELNEFYSHFRISRFSPARDDLAVLETKDDDGLGIIISDSNNSQTTLLVKEDYQVIRSNPVVIAYKYEISIRRAASPVEFYRFDFHPYDAKTLISQIQHTRWHLHCSWNKSARIPTPEMNLILALDFAIRFFNPSKHSRVRVPKSALHKRYDWFERMSLCG